MFVKDTILKAKPLSKYSIWLKKMQSGPVSQAVFDRPCKISKND